MIHPPRLLVVVATLAALPACGSSVSNGPSPALLQVGGNYQIVPTLLQNGCGGTPPVQPGPAQVTHAPGATDVRLSHAGQTYAGRVQPSGAFVMDPLVITFAPGSTDTVLIEGRFTASGFEASATVDAAHAGAAPCRYVVGWLGTRQGGSNVIPG